MRADIESLFISPAVRVFDFRCREEPESISAPEVVPDFEIVFTRQGRFGCRMHNQAHDINSQVVLLNNAGTERVVTHGRRVCDECTVFEVEASLLEEARRLFWQKAVSECSGVRTSRSLFPVAALPSTPNLDYFHHAVHRVVQRRYLAGMSLKIEAWLVRFVEEIYKELYHRHRDDPLLHLDESLKERHLETVERAKAYVLDHFQEEVSLFDIARHAYVSPFHFSRLFRTMAGRSPYRYLIEIRLSHAVLLLRNTSLSITEIGLLSGFNSLSHFIATFTQRFGTSPSRFRRQ